MDLHYSKRKPDWLLADRTSWNPWQRLAHRTRGIITPGNIASISGLVLVCVGAAQVIQDNSLWGLSMIALGRMLDLADGFLAHHTGTKSRLGEAVDSVADKLASLVVFVVFAIAEIMMLWQLIPLFLLQLGNVVATVIARVRCLTIHTSKTGKIATLLQWIAIGLYAVAFLVKDQTTIVTGLAHVVLIVTLLYGVSATLGYYKKALQKPN